VVRRGPLEFRFLLQDVPEQTDGGKSPLPCRVQVLLPVRCQPRQAQQLDRLDQRLVHARVQHNTYSVHSRLIGEEVEARVFAEHVEVWYAERKVETLPRLHGRYRHRIDYRHVIESLVRRW